MLLFSSVAAVVVFWLSLYMFNFSGLPLVKNPLTEAGAGFFVVGYLVGPELILPKSPDYCPSRLLCRPGGFLQPRRLGGGGVRVGRAVGDVAGRDFFSGSGVPRPILLAPPV